MESYKERGAFHRSKILYGIKNPPNNRVEDNYEDCENYVGYDTEENLKFAKIFIKAVRKLDMRIMTLKMFKTMSKII